MDIWWGFTSGDGQWACTNWIPACNQGNRAAIGFPQHFSFNGVWSDVDKLKVAGFAVDAINKMYQVTTRYAFGTEQFRIANNAYNFLRSAKISYSWGRNTYGGDAVGIYINPNTAFDATLVHEAAHCCGHTAHPESRLGSLDLDRSSSPGVPAQAFYGQCRAVLASSGQDACTNVIAGSCKTFNSNCPYSYGTTNAHDQSCGFFGCQVECAAPVFCNIWGNPQDWLASEATGRGMYINR